MSIVDDFMFEPVANWEQLPADVVLGDVAGIAVDSKDRVYLFNRGTHPVVVLDRPNPIGGVAVDGPVNREEGHSSFVGRRPLALRHGMTVGELASLFNAEYVPGATVRLL